MSFLTYIDILVGPGLPWTDTPAFAVLIEPDLGAAETAASPLRRPQLTGKFSAAISTALVVREYECNESRIPIRPLQRSQATCSLMFSCRR